MSPPTLGLFGVLHVDRPGKVRAELDAFADDADALFIEQPETDVTLRTFANVAVRAPTFFLGMLLHAVALMPLYTLLNRAYDEAEAIAVRRVADDRDLPVHRVDDHPVLVTSRAGPRWMLANWLALAGLAWLFGTALAVTAAVLLAGFGATLAAARIDRRLWLVVSIPATWGGLALAAVSGLLSAVPVSLVFAVLVFYLASAGTMNEHRNRHMLRRVAEVSDREGYDRACLVTGKAHLAGLVSLAADADLAVSRMHVSRWLRTSDDVTENPDPEGTSQQPGLDWFLTAFGLTRPDARRGTETDVVGRRTLAACLDLALAGVAGFVGGVVCGAVASVAFGDAVTGLGILVGFAVAPLCYFLVPETALGRTPGKWLLGLVVVAEDGTRPSRRAIAVRNLLRPLDFVLCYAVGLLSVLATRRAQRLGDLVAKTVVARAE